MAFVIEESVDVAAAPEKVWQVITDLPRYGDWNPFVVSCRSSLAVGSPIHMRVHVLQAFAQPQTETVFEHEPGRLLSYGLPGNALGALRSYRSHRVETSPAGGARYHSRFELSGWLAPVVRLFVGRQLRRGFHEMTQAIKARAEGR